MVPDFFENTIFYSLGMTLLHSLWQVIAVFIILKLVLSLLKASDSRAKYHISIVALCSILIISILTFTIYQRIERSEDVLVYYKLVDRTDTGHQTYMSYPSPVEKDVIRESGIDSSDYLPWFVIIYITGIGILTIRFLINLHYLKRFTNLGIIKDNTELESIFNKILSAIKIKKKVNLIESAIAKVPFVLGYFKPVIIVPAGIMMHLPFNQVEAILAHELAHIKRNDFLINIFQSVIELLFFYHPVIYIISNIIRDERENCCDDIALKFCKNTTNYAKALASMEQFRVNRSYPSVAFVKRKKSLLERIKRILKPNEMKTKLSDRIFAAVIVLLGITTLIITGAAALNNVNEENLSFNSENTSINLNSLYENHSKKDSIIEFDDGRIITQHVNNNGKKEEIEMVFDDGVLTQLYVDGNEIPKEDYPKYKEVVKNTLNEVQEAQIEVEKARKEIAEIDREALVAELENAKREMDTLNREEIMLEIQTAMEEAKAEMENINMEEIRAEIEAAMAEVDQAAISAEVRAAMDEVDWEEINAEIEKAMQEAEIELENAEMNSVDINIDMEAIISEAMSAVAEIDWDEIANSINIGLEAAEISLEGLDDIIIGSVDIGLDAALEVLDNLDETIKVAIDGIDIEAITSGIDTADEKLEQDSSDLQKLEENMENALRKLEED